MVLLHLGVFQTSEHSDETNVVPLLSFQIDHWTYFKLLIFYLFSNLMEENFIDHISSSLCNSEMFNLLFVLLFQFPHFSHFFQSPENPIK